MSRRRAALIAAAALLVLLWANNTSLFAPAPAGRPIVVAHRAVAQQYGRSGLGRDDCTAIRIRPPVHPFLENTLPSFREAIRLGADLIELDVSPTADGQVVVFHDWTLDCRTEGHGDVRAHRLAQLKALDVGYGYTADGGRTFPFRGKGVGMMPTLEEVLRAFPAQPFLINFKSRHREEADAVAAAFARARIPITGRYAFYGDGEVLDRMRALAPRSWIWGKSGVKACSLAYLKWGWTGRVPDPCRNATVVVPLNYRWAVWGWPNRFLERMREAGTRVVVMGDLVNTRSPIGIERPEQLAKVPAGFSGYLWIEDIHALRH
jgi:glycerophosphoryl diester phosphodiesterase